MNKIDRLHAIRESRSRAAHVLMRGIGIDRRRLALLAALLLTVALSPSCVHDNQALLHRDATVVPTGAGDFMVTSGQHTVLEVNRFEGRFLSDAANGFALYLEADTDALRPGATLTLPGDVVQCRLWVLEAPVEHTTEHCRGSVRVLENEGNRIVVEVEMKSDDPGFAWALAERRLMFLTAPSSGPPTPSR